MKEINGACEEQSSRTSCLFDVEQTPTSSAIRKQRRFSREDLEACAGGSIFGDGNAQLPSPPLLMLDRITEINFSGGEYDQGYAIAKLDVGESNWFFKHHFQNDPVMPGCLLIESLWQLAGFHLAWCGYHGRGRVIDSGKTKFLQSIHAQRQTLTVAIQIRKIISTPHPITIAKGLIISNNNPICKSDYIKVGLFK